MAQCWLYRYQRGDQIDAAFFDAMMHVNVRSPVLQTVALSPLLADAASVVVTPSVAPYEKLGSIGTADEAASVALFLLSDDASSATAIQYPVDAGMIKLRSTSLTNGGF